MSAVNDRVWNMRLDQIQRKLEQFNDGSRFMTVLGVETQDDEVRTVIQFDTPTLIKPPGKEVKFVGPVLVGLRYHKNFLSQAPIPWEIVSILQPPFIYHPNVNAAGGLCLGKPSANVPIDLILHTTWAALVLNTRLVTTVDWNVFNPAAAAYVRDHKDKFPLVPYGLLEQVKD